MASSASKDLPSVVKLAPAMKAARGARCTVSFGWPSLNVVDGDRS